MKHYEETPKTKTQKQSIWASYTSLSLTWFSDFTDSEKKISVLNMEFQILSRNSSLTDYRYEKKIPTLIMKFQIFLGIFKLKIHFIESIVMLLMFSKIIWTFIKKTFSQNLMFDFPKKISKNPKHFWQLIFFWNFWKIMCSKKKFVFFSLKNFKLFKTFLKK